MTRRENPNDRILELGDASVPFQFDIHAMIPTADAPALENALHRAFHTRRMNRVNERKEFFRVSLHEIEQIVVAHHGTIEFTRAAAAAEYRKTLAMIAEPAGDAVTNVPADKQALVQGVPRKAAVRSVA